MLKLIIVSIFVSSAFCKTYNGYKVYEVTPHTKAQADELMSWEPRVGIDFWSEPRALGLPCLVMVNPDNSNEFQNFLNQQNVTWAIKVDDVESIVEPERKRRRKVNEKFTFSDFHRHEVINDHLEILAERFPDIVTVKTVGTSFEGRSIKSILISDKRATTNKTLMILDGGIHAREWIAPAFCMFVVREMVLNIKKNVHILNKVDWLIVPVVNPDGYEYSHTHERFWRKTRKPNEDEGGTSDRCVGTDGNRNYDFHWGEKGGSNRSCSENYSGPHPSSEPEVKVMSTLMMKYAKPGRTIYLSFHSFGYWLLYPWSYTDEDAPKRHMLQRVGEMAAEAIYRKTGAIYSVGNTVDLLYPAAGGSHDFAMGKAGINLAFTYELPPRSNQASGFVLHPAYIWEICEETWHGVKAMAEYLGYNH